jgi:hypothetical protein
MHREIPVPREIGLNAGLRQFRESRNCQHWERGGEPSF